MSLSIYSSEFQKELLFVLSEAAKIYNSPREDGEFRIYGFHQGLNPLKIIKILEYFFGSKPKGVILNGSTVCVRVSIFYILAKTKLGKHHKARRIYNSYIPHLSGPIEMENEKLKKEKEMLVKENQKLKDEIEVMYKNCRVKDRINSTLKEKLELARATHPEIMYITHRQKFKRRMESLPPSALGRSQSWA